ncbi:MAG: hypothetical protein MK160_04030 [Rhodobacteraceae bacterium]|nr:hypothetical protein [Paracoccaceae bacterium]
MNAMVRHHGRAPVGHLCELGSVEASAVVSLRRWCEGPDEQARVWTDFATALGSERGRAALQAFEGLCDLCLRYGRRPLMRQPLSCKCLSGDEAWFASFVGYASEGQTEDALMLALALVRPDVAPMVVGLAQEAGMALRQMALRKEPANRAAHQKIRTNTLH